jgi:uncharacterized protein with PIN domain
MQLAPRPGSAPEIARAIAADPKRVMSAFSALDARIGIEAKKGEDFAKTDVTRVESSSAGLTEPRP